MRHLLSIVFGAAFTAAASWSIGRLLFIGLRIRLRRVEHDLLAGIAGAALLSLLIFFLCAAHLAYIATFWGIGLAAIGVNWRFSAAAPADAAPARLPAWQKWIFLGPVILFALLYLSNSLAPEHSPDGQAYHLGNVYRFFRQHGFERITTNLYASIPQGAEMLYLFAFSLGRSAAAATFHCCFLFALPLLMFAYGRRIGKPAAGACAGLLFFFSPVAGVDGVSAYNDIALAACAFSVFYLLEIWRENGRIALAVPVGLMAGFCFAIKYSGFAASLYVLAVLTLEFLRAPYERRREITMTAAIAVSLIILMTAPWLIRNWLWLHNPVSPFFNRLFPNPYTHVSFEDFYRHYLRNYDQTSLKPLFWRLTVGGELGGQLGPIFLLTPLALFSLRSREGRRVLLAGFIFLLPYPANIGSRFLLPVLPFAALGIALAFEFSASLRTALVLIAAVLAWPEVARQYAAPGNWQIADMPWKAALGIVSQDAFLAQYSGDWVTARMLDQYVPPGKRVWSTDAIAEAYSKTDVLVDYYSAEGELIQDILYSPTGEERPTWNLRCSFPARSMTHLRLLQKATGGPNEMWSIAEMRFFHGAEEIAPERSWRYSASSFPWDIGLAFDRNPATRWRSWEAIHPGMTVDVDFDRAITIDRVELQCSHDEPNIHVALDGIASTLEKLDLPEFPELRRLATATVKARGIEYLMIGGDGWLAKETHANPARWGLRKVADRGGNWLFEIE